MNVLFFCFVFKIALLCKNIGKFNKKKNNNENIKLTVHSYKCLLSSNYPLLYFLKKKKKSKNE